MSTYDLRANYYALFLSIIKDFSTNESLIQLGILTSETKANVKEDSHD